MKLSGTLFLSVAITVSAIGLLAHPAPQQAEAAAAFLETFTGAPAGPTPWRSPNFDVHGALAAIDTF